LIDTTYPQKQNYIIFCHSTFLGMMVAFLEGPKVKRSILFFEILMGII
jgi:hypothetical protein